MEGVLVPGEGESRLEEGQRCVEADVAGVEGGVGLEVLRQLVVDSRDIGLHRGSVVGEPPGEVSSVVT